VNVNVSNNYRSNYDGSGFNGNHVPGTWTAYIEDDKVYMELTGENWSMGRTFPTAELGTLPTTNEGSFSLTRDAGAMTFKGVFTGGKGIGFYKFAENAGFKSYLEQKGFKDIDDDMMIRVFFTNINKAYFESLKTNGYADVTNEQFKDLVYQNLGPKAMDEYFALFKAENNVHPSLDKIIELRKHGVNARFINGFHDLGYKDISLDKFLELRNHGVNPAYMTSFAELGYKDISPDKALDLRNNGVTVTYIRSLQNIGYKDISLDKAQELRQHGVSAEFIKGFNELGFKNLTLDKAKELREHGVSASYIKNMKSKGNNLSTLDEYIKLRDNGSRN